MSENEKLVERLLGFDKAYPLDIFPEPGTAERAWLAHHRPGLQDRVAASMGRHFAKHAREAAAALTAAEARIKMLEEALAPFGSGAVVFYENEPDDCVLSLGRWKYQEDGRARFYADVQFTVADVRRARALTQETADV